MAGPNKEVMINQIMNTKYDTVAYDDCTKYENEYFYIFVKQKSAYVIDKRKVPNVIYINLRSAYDGIVSNVN